MNVKPALVRRFIPIGWHRRRHHCDCAAERSDPITVSPPQSKSARDPRIDFLRGMALITIFVDHVPANPLNLLTMRNFGFADAAELFVILAGISSMMAYGKSFEREGPQPGLWRI